MSFWGIVSYDIPNFANIARLMMLLFCIIADGRLRQTTLKKMCQDTVSSSSDRYVKTSEASLGAPVLNLQFVNNEKTNERLIVGGGDDGSVGIWNMECVFRSFFLFFMRSLNVLALVLSSLKLCAHWTIFITPFHKVIQFADEDLKTSPLRGCILCVSEDGTVAVVAVDSLQL
jgi:WD repeat-containing protein 7